MGWVVGGMILLSHKCNFFEYRIGQQMVAGGKVVMMVIVILVYMVVKVVTVEMVWRFRLG